MAGNFRFQIVDQGFTHRGGVWYCDGDKTAALAAGCRTARVRNKRLAIQEFTFRLIVLCKANCAGNWFPGELKIIIFRNS